MGEYKNPTHTKIWYCDACMAWKEIDAFDWRITKAWCVKCYKRINQQKRKIEKIYKEYE